jgi:3-phenylpropionate/cinnamic acid dioxygenase small subunit
MDADLRQLFDLEEIKQLKARYCRFVDGKEWEGFRTLFADDAVFDLEGMGQFDSAESFVAAVSSRNPESSRTVHQTHTPEISVNGDEATGIWPMYDFVDRIVDDGRKAFQGYGYYHETYRREDGTWRIASLRLVRLRRDEVVA